MIKVCDCNNWLFNMNSALPRNLMVTQGHVHHPLDKYTVITKLQIKIIILLEISFYVDQ